MTSLLWKTKIKKKSSKRKKRSGRLAKVKSKTTSLKPWIASFWRCTVKLHLRQHRNLERGTENPVSRIITTNSGDRTKTNLQVIVYNSSHKMGRRMAKEEMGRNQIGITRIIRPRRSKLPTSKNKKLRNLELNRRVREENSKVAKPKRVKK